MPQPPGKDDTRESYMSKCVKQLKKEGKSDKKASEICYAVWMGHKVTK
jgi:hypothetical protein